MSSGQTFQALICMNLDALLAEGQIGQDMLSRSIYPTVYALIAPMSRYLISGAPG